MPQRELSWLRLLAYCTITVLATALGFAILFAGVSVTFAVGQPAQASELATQASFTGMVTCAHCGAKHARYPGKTAAECARLCAIDGSKYILIDGDQVYTLTGNDLALDKLAGRRGTVVGTLQGTVVTVNSVP
jgi:hypothetical protein